MRFDEERVLQRLGRTPAERPSSALQRCPPKPERSAMMKLEGEAHARHCEVNLRQNVFKYGRTRKELLTQARDAYAAYGSLLPEGKLTRTQAREGYLIWCLLRLGDENAVSWLLRALRPYVSKAWRSRGQEVERAGCTVDDLMQVALEVIWDEFLVAQARREVERGLPELALVGRDAFVPTRSRIAQWLGQPLVGRNRVALERIAGLQDPTLNNWRSIFALMYEAASETDPDRGAEDLDALDPDSPEDEQLSTVDLLEHEVSLSSQVVQTSGPARDHADADLLVGEPSSDEDAHTDLDFALETGFVSRTEHVAFALVLQTDAELGSRSERLAGQQSFWLSLNDQLANPLSRDAAQKRFSSVAARVYLAGQLRKFGPKRMAEAVDLAVHCQWIDEDQLRFLEDLDDGYLVCASRRKAILALGERGSWGLEPGHADGQSAALFGLVAAMWLESPEARYFVSKVLADPEVATWAVRTKKVTVPDKLSKLPQVPHGTDAWLWLGIRPSEKARRPGICSVNDLERAVGALKDWAEVVDSLSTERSDPVYAKAAAVLQEIDHCHGPLKDKLRAVRKQVQKMDSLGDGVVSASLDAAVHGSGHRRRAPRLDQREYWLSRQVSQREETDARLKGLFSVLPEDDHPGWALALHLARTRDHYEFNRAPLMLLLRGLAEGR